MNCSFITLSVHFVVLLVLWGCEEKEPIKPDNPLNGKTTAVFNSNLSYGKMSDIEGNEYKTITIGSQTWMAENLRTTRYRNGDSIPNVIENSEWGNLSTGAFCNYNNSTNEDSIATFGRLYNWFAVSDDRGLAPKGWRVPDVYDWEILTVYLGGDSLASSNLKEVGNTHWGDPFDSNNCSGFTALPSGRRYLVQNFSGIGYYSVYWTSSEFENTKAGFLYLFCYDSFVWKGLNYKQNGYAIRCIKD